MLELQISSMAEPVCIICDEPGGELRTIQVKAINTLADSSRKRRDRKYLKWSQLKSASVHKICSQRYTRESAVTTAAAEHVQKIVEGKGIVKNALNFDFKNLWFFLR